MHRRFPEEPTTDLMSKEQLYQIRQPSPSDNGIYFLWDGDELVYVGQTTYSVAARIYAHAADKQFDSYTFIPIDQEAHLDHVEAAYIFHFCPKYNRALLSNPRYKARGKIQEALSIDGWGFRRLVKKGNIRPNPMNYYDLREFEEVIASER